MHYCVLAAFQRFKSLSYNVLTALGKHLYRYVVRYHILLYKRSQKRIFCLGSRRKTYFYFLKAYLHKQSEKIQLFFKIHRNDK